MNRHEGNIAQTEENKDNMIEIEIPYSLFQYLSTEKCNIQSICRICLSVNELMIPLYSDKDSVLADMFMAIGEVQISAEDGLPSNICQLCKSEVINYYEFKMKCVKADYTLKSILKEDFIYKEESTQFNTTAEIKTKLNTQTEINQNAIEGIKEEIEQADVNYLENLKDSMNDDEALCIVRDTTNNEKEITIINNDPNTLFEEVLIKKLAKAKVKETNTGKKKTKHKCNICFKKFNKIKSLRTHIARLHAAVTESDCTYPCGQCKETFESEFDLRIHKMLHIQVSNWKCTECQKNFKDKKSLRRHIMRHMKSKRYQCTACGAKFVELYALRRHMRVHTGERMERKHPCEICDEKFVDMSRLREHMARHDGERGHVCECGAAFPSARLLKSHRRVHSAEKPHACLHCGQRFRHESTRNTHQRTHTGERPYVCVQCGKCFIQKSNMTLHMRTHTGERPYSCSICDRKFSSGSTLKAHNRTHTGERPYTCKVCGKSFAYVNLKLHMRLHTGERPYACPACPKRFNTAPRLREHHRLHTGERPFECAMCTRKFATKSQLINHIKTHEKKRTGKKETVMLMPVTVATKDALTQPQLENKIDESVLTAPNVPSIEQQFCTVEEVTIEPSQRMVYEDDDSLKTEVIVLDNDTNLAPNDVNLVTLNEGEVSISAASATVEGTTVKLYQYDQSLLQIHTGGGQLIVSRISSKMTANF